MAMTEERVVGGALPPRRSRQPVIMPPTEAQIEHMERRYAAWRRVEGGQPYERIVALRKCWMHQGAKGDTYYHHGRLGFVPSAASSAWFEMNITPESGSTLVVFWPKRLPVAVPKSLLALHP